jgi:hypothetical protein
MKSIIKPILVIAIALSIIQIVDSVGALSSGIGGRYWVMLFFSTAVLVACIYAWRVVSRTEVAPSVSTVRQIPRRSFVIVFSLPLLFIVVNGLRIGFREFYLGHVADHPRILAACREAIAKRKSYRNDKNKWRTLDKDDVLLLRPIPSEVPEAIRNLNPRDVIIREDSVIINLGLPFCRIGLVAFPTGAKQYGTEKYIDGLWFWNGDDYSKEKISH